MSKNNTRPKRQSKGKEIFKRLRRNKMAMAGLVILAFLILIAAFAPWIAPYGYDEQNLDKSLMKPNAEHWFGTDLKGRDVMSRMIYGARVSLMVGFLAVSISVVIGGLLGAIAGYFGGRLDNIIMRCMDVLLAIPSILLAISIAASLGPGLVNLMIAVGISSIPGYARLVRASTLSIRNIEYIEASKSVGSSDFSIIIKHVIPNCISPVIVQATLGVAFAILTAASLSFIGLGIKPPQPEWGAMLSSGRTYIRDYSYLTLFPGLAIMVTILALNFLGDGLRDALDPKLKN
ncbi:ABC transporter permease [Acidaminobacter sp. JC074]|uniref:ABC transporter permease n=1 Tax=Acidaminobacter sp. JC074 TaxID=2530199 RepID=UPI001F10107A|nr:ABC transporter permease [Acidaminobacter sp. JC074]MCH4886839.1 ABC transporter permease [Acidaminobacter sp. JC074]